ncbi:MAG: exodeoxyribonuclease VII small subunit [Gammaproteobacteria bacterium]|nr:exodeoxyribonuclease VII small subunit [Gammaproteobacteria bacterium]
MSDEKNEKKLSEQIDELSVLVKRLEDPSIELEDALGVYESGMKIAQAAQKALEQAQQRIETVSGTTEN